MDITEKRKQNEELTNMYVESAAGEKPTEEAMRCGLSRLELKWIDDAE